MAAVRRGVAVPRNIHFGSTACGTASPHVSRFPAKLLCKCGSDRQTTASVCVLRARRDETDHSSVLACMTDKPAASHSSGAIDNSNNRLACCAHARQFADSISATKQLLPTRSRATR
eukprot:5917989-Alexandrium_andersonii.AAC.1